MTDIVDLSDAMGTFYPRSQRILDRLMRANGLSITRWKLLHFIRSTTSTPRVDIAMALEYASRTVTQAIVALERERLIQRLPVPGDRRAKHIAATTEG